MQPKSSGCYRMSDARGAAMGGVASSRHRPARAAVAHGRSWILGPFAVDLLVGGFLCQLDVLCLCRVVCGGLIWLARLVHRLCVGSVSDGVVADLGSVVAGGEASFPYT